MILRNLAKKTNNSTKDDIIEYKGEPMEISTFYIGDKYTLINDLERYLALVTANAQSSALTNYALKHLKPGLSMSTAAVAR